MEVANVIKGLAFVKKHFPHAKMPNEKNKSAMGVLEFLGGLEQPLPSDIVTQFDDFGVGIWGGEEIR